MRQYVAQKFNPHKNICHKKIVIIDNASIMPYAIAKLIAKHPMMTVVGHEGNGSAALALCRKLMPDIAIIDPILTGLDGASIIKQMRRINPDVSILVYSLENKKISLQDYIELYVNAIVLKTSPIETLVNAIQHIASGKNFLDDALSPSASSQNSKSVFQDVSLALPHLSPREKQVLKMIVEGGKNKEIARILSISVKTIESHRLNLMRKLNAHSVLDLIRWAQRMNISN